MARECLAKGKGKEAKEEERGTLDRKAALAKERARIATEKEMVKGTGKAKEKG